MEHDHLVEMLNRLKLTAIRDQLDSLIDEAGRRELTIREALSLLCEREIARKDERRIEMSIGLARFPFVRDLDGFEERWHATPASPARRMKVAPSDGRRDLPRPATPVCAEGCCNWLGVGSCFRKRAPWRNGIGLGPRTRCPARKTMIVASARKLLIALWRYTTIGEIPGRRRPAPGSVTGHAIKGMEIEQHRRSPASRRMSDRDPRWRCTEEVPGFRRSTEWSRHPELRRRCAWLHHGRGS